MTASPNDPELEARAAAKGQLKTPVEARQGVKTNHVRWMLGVSLALGIVVLGGALAWYTAQPQNHEPSPSPQAAATSQQANS